MQKLLYGILISAGLISSSLLFAQDTDYYPHAHSTHQASVGEDINARLSINYSF